MIGKNNHYLRDTKDGTKVESYSIKKFKVGAASVVIGASIFFGAGAVAQASEEMSNNTTADNTTSVGEKEGVAEVPVATAQPVAKETIKEDVVSAVAAKLGGETAKEVKALDKTTLEKYVAEIEAKLVNGTYANKTEESVALLKADLEAAKTTLANATTKDELTKAYGKLVTTANTKLRAKPVEKKETLEVDTTNGQPTVGKKAENTEKKSESNSIENTGSNDSRNGQALDKNNAFRAEASKPVGQTPEITSNLNGKSSTPADVTVKAPAGSTVKLYNKDGVVIGEAVANDQGVATVHPTNSLPEGEITATSTPAGGTESAKSSPITVTKTPVTGEDGGVSRGGDNTQLLVSKSHITVYPGDSVKVDVIAASNAIENFSVPGNPTAISGVLPVGAFLTTAGSSTYKQRNAAYQGTVAETQKAGDTVVTFSVRSKRNAVVTRNLKVTVLETAKKYEPVAGTKVDIADSNNVSGDEKNKIIAAVKAANSSLPADSQYSIDEKGNLTITYPDGSTDKIAAAYLVNPTTPTPPANQSAPVVAPTAEIPFSNAETKEIYLYNEEDASINITINSTNGAISKAFIKSAGNVYLDPDKKARKLPPGNETQEEVDGFGWTYHQILNDTPSPATVRITGKPNDTFKGLNAYTKQEDQNAVLGDRYLQVQDTAGGAIAAGGNSNAAGYFKLVVKSQTYKYDIKDLTDSTRITVNDINNVTDAELTTIKSRLQLEYSQKSNDARFVRGAAVANPTSLIDTVAVSTTDPSKLVVTYIDGSTDTIEKNKVLNVRPKGIIPFSNPATKEIYVYKGEETNIELSATDDSGKIKDIRIAEGGRGNNAPGAAGGRIKNQYGLTTGYQRNEAGIEATETNPAKVTITGTISVPNQPNYTGNLITRYLVAEDLEGATFSEPNGNSDSGKTVDQLPEGWFRLVVREQTQKYDIQGQTEEGNKIAVSDVNNLSDADFEKIKNNIKIQYKTADDERLKDKDGTLVENASQYIKSITKEGDKIVVTYKDGSTDKLTLTDVVTLDKQPAIDAVNTAATEKIAAIKATPNATDEEKAAAIAKVNADKEKALTAIKDASVRTKDALNQAQNNGTAAIAADNPVVAKKADAKAAIETARKAKEDAIKANTNLTEDEKTAAIAKVNDAATAATTKIDSATANKAVEDAQNEATTAIGKVNPVAKVAAKKAIADELSDKNTEIDGRQDLSQAEKTAAKAEAKKLADAQLAEIAKQPDATETPEAATTAQQAVDAAKTKGVADVRAVNPLAKDAAKADIETARQNKVNDITNNNNLSQAEKDAAIAKVNKVAEDATKAVDAATTADALTAAKGDGTTAINNVTPVAKEAAKQAIADALNGKDGQKGKLQEIEERTDLTTEEKAAAKKDAQDKANAELAKINAQPDAADTPDAATAVQTAVDAAGAKGKTDVESVNPAAKAKPEAKAAVEATRKAKEDAIKADANLTDDEKTAAIAKANKAAEDATKAIDAATTNQAVTDAQTAATTAVGKVNPIAKENAKTAIATALTAKNNEIDNRQDLTDAEKKVAKDAAKAKADAELAKINAQPDNAETADAATAAQTAVNDAGTKGVADVKTVNPIAKEKAKEAIATALTAKNGEIDARQDLTDDEKTAAKAEAKKLADVETAKVAAQPDNAETADAAITAQTAVNDAKDKGVGDVTAVRPIAKEKAKEAIVDELTKKEAAIDARTDLTTEEKAAAKKDAQAKAKTATDAITAQPAVVDSEEKATAAQGAVDTAKNTGVSEVQAVNPTAVKKPEAKAAVEAARKAKEDAIKADSNLTQAEKDVAIAKNNKAAEDATKAIDAATTDTVVEQAKTAGTGEIAKVNPVAKEKAKEAIATALTAKNNEIDARKDLTDDEKTAAKAEAKKLADAETAKVDGQPDNAETADAATAAQTAVNDAKDKGVGDVTAVRPIAKEKAKEAIAAELTKKEAAIDARTDLTTEEKAAAKKDAQAKAKTATDAITAQPAVVDSEEKATAAQGAVDTAKNTGVSEVQAVNPTAVKKPEAKKAVADALKAKEEAIDARTDLSDKEKAAAKLAAKNIADAAKKAIDNATTDADVANAQTVGTNDIATVNPVAKEKAKQAVADELAKKEEAIDARDDLTQEEKDAAKKEAQAKAKEATDAINAQPDTVDTPEEATTAQQAVDAAKDKGVADVAAVNPTAVTKPAAKKAIEDKLVKQLEDIANTPDATDEEKAEATEKAKAAAEKAKAEVDKATTDAAVKTEKDKAVGEGDTKGTIDQAVPVVEDKPNARKAIDEQTKAKKAEIDARTDLSPKAKEALKAKVDKVAKKAKEGIDAVTSKADVDVIKEADKAAIKAIGEVNRPIDKVLVKDPSALTDEEKAKILEEVKKVNPTAKLLLKLKR